MDIAGHVLLHATNLALRAASSSDPTSTITSPSATAAAASASASSTTTVTRPPSYKIIGISLAVCSGLFIGCSFVLKKIGLLKANVQYHEEAGEGYGYLRNVWWWLGMTLMIIGEICNFVAYAFTDAILVTPLGALAVVLTAILSWIFLKERLSFVGWVACFLCIVGSVVITLNAPEQAAVADIQEMQHYVIAPGFLSYAGVIIVVCLVVIFYVAPRYGKKTMLVYLTVCSLIGGLSVVATQGLGAAFVAQFSGEQQFNHWFLYVLFVFVITTLVTEIIYLNKALNLFNAALVTPTYYVYFTSSTIVASAVLFQGFHGTAIQIIDVVLGFFTICSGVVLLQLAKSSKDVPDSKVLSGDLDQIRTVAEVEEPEYEPRADTIRGGAGIVRALSTVRTKRQADEAIRIYGERMQPINENETLEWDGLRRRKTVSSHGGGSVRKTAHPPLGMTQFPDDISDADSEVHPGFFGRIGRKVSRGSQGEVRTHSPVSLHEVEHHVEEGEEDVDAQRHAYDPAPGILESPESDHEETTYKGLSSSGTHVRWAGENNDEQRMRASSHHVGGPPPRPPPHSSQPTQRRQFSFQHVFNRTRANSRLDENQRPISRGGLSFASRHSSREYPAGGLTTEEERLGLVHGDSQKTLPVHDEDHRRESDEWQTSSSPEKLDMGADFGRRSTHDPYLYDGDELYDESLHTSHEPDDSRIGPAFV